MSKMTILGGLFGLLALTTIVNAIVHSDPTPQREVAPVVHTAEEREHMFPMNEDAMGGCALQLIVTTGEDRRFDAEQCGVMRHIAVSADPDNSLQNCTMGDARLYARFHGSQLPNEHDRTAIFVGCSMMLYGMPMKAAYGAYIAAQAHSTKQFFPQVGRDNVAD